MATLRVPIASEDHAQGLETAEVTLVEYGDYECPHCGRAYPIVKRIQERFGKRLRFVFRNFPMSETHPHAEAAAEVAEFAGAQEKFWEMHDLLFENQARLGEPLFLDLARSLQLSTIALRQALERREFEARVRGDFNGGVRSGVNGTPTFLSMGIAMTDPLTSKLSHPPSTRQSGRREALSVDSQNPAPPAAVSVARYRDQTAKRICTVNPEILG